MDALELHDARSESRGRLALLPRTVCQVVAKEYSTYFETRRTYACRFDPRECVRCTAALRPKVAIYNSIHSRNYNVGDSPLIQFHLQRSFTGYRDFAGTPNSSSIEFPK
ncbi:unnamed protein product [Lasius platythorax]|uniref:Uncharacterized protein n=1 Tax=Lasius platythorax TaxID=488582 RepID=A0AAV2NF56_9HYME